MSKNSFKNVLDAMEQLGKAMAGITDLAFLQVYLVPRHITNLDPARYPTLLVELENRVTKWNDMHSTTLLEAHNLAQKVEDHTTPTDGIWNQLSVYVAKNHEERKKGGCFGVESGGGHFAKVGRFGAGNCEGHMCNSRRGQVQNNQPGSFNLESAENVVSAAEMELKARSLMLWDC
jgi:hypothetical protein